MTVIDLALAERKTETVTDCSCFEMNWSGVCHSGVSVYSSWLCSSSLMSQPDANWMAHLETHFIKCGETKERRGTVSSHILLVSGNSEKCQHIRIPVNKRRLRSHFNIRCKLSCITLHKGWLFALQLHCSRVCIYTCVCLCAGLGFSDSLLIYFQTEAESICFCLSWSFKDGHREGEGVWKCVCLCVHVCPNLCGSCWWWLILQMCIHERCSVFCLLSFFSPPLFIFFSPSFVSPFLHPISFHEPLLFPQCSLNQHTSTCQPVCVCMCVY